VIESGPLLPDGIEGLLVLTLSGKSIYACFASWLCTIGQGFKAYQIKCQKPPYCSFV
jgi:hypothetical protein